MSILNEEWRDCAGYEGFYQVSNLGRVRSCDRVGNHAVYGSMVLRGKILKPATKTGYSTLVFSVLNSQCTVYVHALVAQAFIGDRPEFFQINHIDGNKQNNSLVNLEYCTPKENTRHAFALGLCRTARGEDCAKAKLKAFDIPVIRNRLAIGHLQKDIAFDYGVSHQVIHSIKVGKSWTHIK